MTATQVSVAVVVMLAVLGGVVCAPVASDEKAVVPGMPASGIWNTDIVGTFSVASLPPQGPNHVTVSDDDESLMSLQPKEPEPSTPRQEPSRLVTHNALHIGTAVPPSPAGEDTTPRSHEIPLFPTRYEEHEPAVTAWTLDGRNEMKPSTDDPLDEDCDSPQIGESETYPQGMVDANMNANTTSNITVPEQDPKLRDVLNSDVVVGQPAFEAVPEVLPVDGGDSTSALPEPDKETAQRSKCSRSVNGNDVPDALGELGEDCGMPEPEIPCETAGNSTRCEPRLILRPPSLPPADKMPPIPPPFFQRLPNTVSTHIEFPDYGSSVPVTLPGNASVIDAILDAGSKLLVRDWHVHLIRNAGADVPHDRLMGHLEDPQTVVVYLMCSARNAADVLIVALPICEDLQVVDLEVRVEVPFSDDVFVVAATSTMDVANVIARTPLAHASIDKVTYNGARVSDSQSLAALHFANRSALVVYLAPALAPPSSPLSVVWAPPAPEAPELSTPTPAPATDDSAPSTPSDYPPIPIPEIVHESWPRPEMTEPAVVLLRINDGLQVDLPVLLHPEDLGGVMFDALRESTGKTDKLFSIVFHRLRIDIQTPVKSFGFISGDVIPVQMLPS